jgi:GNAT superfamily N-acetyltransferase
MNQAPILIRSYRPEDRSTLREIFCQTSFHGRPHTVFFDDGDWLADIMTTYYTEYEPESCFVAETDNRVVGYLTGTEDTARFHKIWAAKVLPIIIVRFFTRAVWRYKSTWLFFFHGIKSILQRESADVPGVLQEYPAHFHINVSSGAQSRGVGRQLALHFIERLKNRSISGVHARTSRSDGRHPFFESLGFQKLYSGKLTIWNYLGGGPYEMITYGLRLSPGDK